MYVDTYLLIANYSRNSAHLNASSFPSFSTNTAQAVFANLHRRPTCIIALDNGGWVIERRAGAQTPDDYMALASLWRLRRAPALFEPPCLKREISLPLNTLRHTREEIHLNLEFCHEECERCTQTRASVQLGGLKMGRSN